MFIMKKPSIYRKVNDADFEKIVLQEKKNAVVVFGKESMGGIALLHTIFESLAFQFQKIHFLHIDLAQSQLGEKYGVQNSVITIFFKDGVPFDYLTRMISKAEFKQKCQQLIQSS